MIELSQKQSDAWHYLTDNETTELLYGGGAGGGKSYLGCLWHIDRRNRYANSRGLIGRAELKSIKESTLITYLKVCDLLGYKAGQDYKFNGQDMVITWSNGSKTIFKDLSYKPSDPSFESLGSTEYTDAFIDEAGEVIEKAVDILNSRLRWKIADFGLVPKLLLTCNPNHNWIKFKYIKNEEGQKVYLKPYQKYVKALVDDNPDEAFKDLYKQQLNRMSSQYDKDRLLFGDWDAMPRTGGEFWKQFNRDLHVSKNEWNRELPLHISWDENVNPYLTCLVWQIEVDRMDNKIVRQIDEICLPDPRNRVKYVCGEFKRRYHHEYVPKLFIYGDATSKKDDVKKEKGENLFTDIENCLDDYRITRRVPAANPSVWDSGNFIDDIYASKIDGVTIEIGENCIKSIHDYCYAKESDGGIDKKKVKDPVTGITYEEYGHCSDAKRYFITQALSVEYGRFKSGGKQPIVIVGKGRVPDTRHGY